MIIDPFHLKIVQSVYQTKTLVGASKALCLTQSALSQAIKKLEKQLGVVVWEKSGRTIQLTTAGLFLVDAANRILPQLEQLGHDVKKLSSGVVGHLRIGMECYPCYRWIRQIIGTYLTDWPDVDLDILKQFTFKGMQALLNHEVDILITPDAVSHQGVVFYPVFDYEQVLVVANAHPFARRAYIQPDDLKDQVLITYPIETHRLDIYKDFMTPNKILPTKHVYIEDTDILLQMVAANRGVSALPRWLVEEEQRQFGITPVSLGDPGVFQTIYLGVREDRKRPAYQGAFLELAGARLSE